MNIPNNQLPLQNNNFAALVTEKIRRAIIIGKLAAGEGLVETSHADQLGISRSPICEALKRLEAEGIITKKKVRRYEVWAPTAKVWMKSFPSVKHLNPSHMKQPFPL